VEFLNASSSGGHRLRTNAVGVIDQIFRDPRIEVVAHTPELFRRALALYRDRSDKDWSLTDCASFVIMDERGITEALTHDRHFEQRGYRALLRA
jgi:predicted nucleic acid-binding protein